MYKLVKLIRLSCHTIKVQYPFSINIVFNLPLNIGILINMDIFNNDIPCLK